MSDLKGKKVILHDMCLRDGMHAKKEQISVEQMVKVATAMDDAGVPYIQVNHGAGLGGNSLQHGFAMASNEEYISAVAEQVKNSIISVLLIPGLGTMKELKSAYESGARSVHVATHCTEADTSPQHIAYARELGMDTSGFLMMSHLNDAKGLAEQALLMESYGANTVYITDSACVHTVQRRLRFRMRIGPIYSSPGNCQRRRARDSRWVVSSVVIRGFGVEPGFMS